MTRPALDIITELGIVLDGDTLERLRDLLADPDADFSHGQLARMGKAFTELGNELTRVAKEPMVGVVHHVEDDVLFRWRDPREDIRINTAKIKEEFPYEDPANRDLYKTIKISGSVAVEVM